MMEIVKARNREGLVGRDLSIKFVNATMELTTNVQKKIQRELLIVVYLTALRRLEIGPMKESANLWTIKLLVSLDCSNRFGPV